MSGYLVFAIVDCHEFQGLHLSKQVDLKIDPIYTWYPSLWKQKAMYHFYEVYNSFLSSFKRLMFGKNTARLSLEATSFLDQRGTFESNEKYSIIRIYCSREPPIYLSFYVSDKMFIIEVCRQYKFWENFFCQRKKKQFIQFPWKVGEITVKNASKIDEFVTQFDQYNLKLADLVKGFDPLQSFMNHMTYVGFSVSYINTYIFGEEENDENNYEEIPVGDLETIISTNEAHMQHGRVVNEKSTKSQIHLRKVAHQNDIPKMLFKKNKNLQLITQEMVMILIIMKRILKNVINYQCIKEKGKNSQQESEEYIPEDDVLLQDMELDANIEDIEFPDDEQRIQPEKEVVVQETCLL
jgi:hypothetical protein